MTRSITETTDSEVALRKLFLRYYKIDDSIVAPYSPTSALRTIEVTPYVGAYGIAGYVIALNGSPPRGLFITVASHDVVYISHDGRPRTLWANTARIVWDYLAQRGIESDNS